MSIRIAIQRPSDKITTVKSTVVVW